MSSIPQHEWMLAHQRYMDQFHAHLVTHGYEVPRDSKVFRALFDLYMTGEWGEMVQTDFAPVWIWNARAKALLSPFMKVSIE